MFRLRQHARTCWLHDRHQRNSGLVVCNCQTQSTPDTSVPCKCGCRIFLWCKHHKHAPAASPMAFTCNFPLVKAQKCYDEVKKSAGLMSWSRQPSGQKTHTRKGPPSRTTQDSPCCFFFTMCECEKVAAASMFAAAAILGFRMPRGAKGPSAVMLRRSWIAARNSGWS